MKITFTNPVEDIFPITSIVLGPFDSIGFASDGNITGCNTGATTSIAWYDTKKGVYNVNGIDGSIDYSFYFMEIK